ncbi:hypothetical protein M446_5938 [Methylobacterium sp. 4-46]|nr:hypothetical protein M446_5938 [Methylobacterium sp. 4-46]
MRASSPCLALAPVVAPVVGPVLAANGLARAAPVPRARRGIAPDEVRPGMPSRARARGTSR